MLTNKEQLHLSRAMSHALRHEPWLYELELDRQGWVTIADLIAALRYECESWAQLGRTDIEAMMASAEKQRFEIAGERIRAFYGHSMPDRLEYELSQPPEILYHGTTPDTKNLILEGGLKPMGRQFVHLSADVETAIKVGERKSKNPVVLHIAAAKAFLDGIAFYHGNQTVWLADAVPARYISDGKVD